MNDYYYRLIRTYQAFYDLTNVFNQESEVNKKVISNIQDFKQKYKLFLDAYQNQNEVSATDLDKANKEIHWMNIEGVTIWFKRYLFYSTHNYIPNDDTLIIDYYESEGGKKVQEIIDKSSTEEILCCIKYRLDNSYDYSFEYNHASSDAERKYRLLEEIDYRVFHFNETRKHNRNYELDCNFYARFTRASILIDKEYYLGVYKRDVNMLTITTINNTARRNSKQFKESQEYLNNEMIDNIKYSNILQSYEEKRPGQAEVKYNIFMHMPQWLLKRLSMFSIRMSWMLIFLPLCLVANRGLSGAIFIITVYTGGSIIGSIAKKYVQKY